MTVPLYTIDDILAATGGIAHGVDGAMTICSVSIDSRDYVPDALFVAIKGDRFDGHDFVDRALANGAVAALVSRGDGDRRIIVGNALEGLQNIARFARARSRATIVGITGSVGKTTTKEAIRVIFEAAGETHASIKSFNNHWGVPLTLARLPAAAQFGVFEMGMSGPKEIRSLSQLVRPQVAVITTIAPAHLQAFGSMEEIARAKAEIFSGLDPGGVVVVNGDHPQIDVLLAEARAAGVERVVTYGFASGMDWHVGDVTLMADRSAAMVTHAGVSHRLALNVPGRHMIANGAAALAVAHCVGIEAELALRALAAFGVQAGRGLRMMLGPAEKPLLLLDESYNANTASMQAALDVFAAQVAPGGRKIVLLGDMLELGAESLALHASLASAVTASGADRVYLVGTQVQALAEVLGPDRVAGIAQTVTQMMPILLDDLAYGDAIMIKGSNGVGLSRIVETIRQRFERN